MAFFGELLASLALSCTVFDTICVVVDGFARFYCKVFVCARHTSSESVARTDNREPSISINGIAKERRPRKSKLIFVCVR